MTRYTTGGWANYVQAVCRCRRGWMCPFCRRGLKPGTPKQPTGKDNNACDEHTDEQVAAIAARIGPGLIPGSTPTNELLSSPTADAAPGR